MTRDDIFMMALEASATGDASELTGDAIERFARLVAAAEREAIAKLCDAACLDIGCTATEAEGVVRRTRDAIADAIRKRGAL